MSIPSVPNVPPADDYATARGLASVPAQLAPPNEENEGIVLLKPVDAINTSRPLSDKALDVYVIEYQQCNEHFRSLYSTVWQLAATFAAITAAIIAFAAATAGKETFPLGIMPLTVAPVPMLSWFIMFYRPMHRYATLRSQRAEQIERILHAGAPDIDLELFGGFNKARGRSVGRSEDTIRDRLHLMRFWKQPRITDNVIIRAVLLVIIQTALIIINIVSPRALG